MTGVVILINSIVEIRARRGLRGRMVAPLL